jgi:hypothetical protein
VLLNLFNGFFVFHYQMVLLLLWKLCIVSPGVVSFGVVVVQILMIRLVVNFVQLSFRQKDR